MISSRLTCDIEGVGAVFHHFERGEGEGGRGRGRGWREAAAKAGPRSEAGTPLFTEKLSAQECGAAKESLCGSELVDVRVWVVRVERIARHEEHHAARNRNGVVAKALVEASE